MEVHADELFFSQLAEAGSYWGVRYADLQGGVCDPDCVLRCFDGVAVGCEVSRRAELLELIKERNSIKCVFRRQNVKLDLRGNLGLQLIQTLASLVPSVLGGGVLSIIVFAPLHVLGNLVESEMKYSYRSIFVIDLKSIKGRVQTDRGKSNPETTKQIPLAPPSPPTSIELVL